MDAGEGCISVARLDLAQIDYAEVVSFDTVVCRGW
jgi:hypothetical protein